jgi:hypothetical protein
LRVISSLLSQGLCTTRSRLERWGSADAYGREDIMSFKHAKLLANLANVIEAITIKHT